MWLWTINGGYIRDSKNLSHPTSNGLQVRWAKRLAFKRKTLPLMYWLALEVRMTPFSTAQSMITKLRVSSLLQFTILVLLMNLMTLQESSYLHTSTKPKYGPLPITISLMWHQILSSKSTGERTAPHGPTTWCFSSSKIHLLWLLTSKFKKLANKQQLKSRLVKMRVLMPKLRRTKACP
jgi:hypothetical protein